MKIDKQSSLEMHYALIAAGEGSRLKEEGVEAPKPLVKIQGLPMIDRLIGIFMRNGARSISIICNEQMTEVQEHLLALKDSSLLQATDAEGRRYTCPLHIVVQSTPSSMHSLAALTQMIPEGRFCLTTVDTIFDEEEFSSFIRTFASMKEEDGDGLFAVTTFVDDEKPLWVGLNSQKTFSCACASHSLKVQGRDLTDTTCPNIVGFYDREDQIPAMAEKTVSGGIYCLNTRQAFPVLRACLEQGQSRMRNYQRALILAGLKLKAYIFPKIMDIDHASDITKAEEWLASPSKKRRMLAVARDKVYSPNNEEKDASIWREVLSRLRQQGWQIEECTESEWMSMTIGNVAARYSLIIHMARRMRSLMRLEQTRIPVLNLPQAVRVVSKSRELTMSMLQQAGVSVPVWWAYDPEEDEMFMCEPHLQHLLPGWVKAMREDGVRSDDVRFVQTPLEADSYILELAAQNVPDIVVTQHVDGDLIKCYAVLAEDSTFLRWFYPQESGYSKFGEAETHNSELSHVPVDEEKLRSLAETIGQTLRLQIFGFDIIAKSDGALVVIDVNDWPSFSMCREEAAEAIASLIDKKNTDKR